MAGCGWGQWRANPARTGHNTSETTLSPANVAGLKVKRTYFLGSWAKSEPLVVDGKLIVPTWDGLRAFNVADGTKVWDALMSPGGSIAPGILSSDGTNVYADKPEAFDLKTGARVWSLNLGSQNPASLLVGGTLVTSDTWGFKVHALDAKTGNLRWEYEFGSPFNPQLVASDGTFVYVLAAEQTSFGCRGPQLVYKFRLSDGANFAAAYAGESRGCRELVLADDQVFVTNADGIWALNQSDLLRRWTYAQPVNRLAVAGGHIYGIGTVPADPQTQIVKIRTSDGARVARTDNPGEGTPVVANGVLYSGRCAFDLNLNLLFKPQGQNRAQACRGNSIVANGHLFTEEAPSSVNGQPTAYTAWGL